MAVALRFMPKLLSCTIAPCGEKVDVEGAIESSSRGRKTIVHTAIGVGAGALLVESSAAPAG